MGLEGGELRMSFMFILEERVVVSLTGCCVAFVRVFCPFGATVESELRVLGFMSDIEKFDYACPSMLTNLAISPHQHWTE